MFVVVSGPPAAIEMIRKLPGAVVEIFCRCDRAVAQRRYRDRAGTRHAGHFDSVRDFTDLWNEDVTEPLAAGWPLLEVDTNKSVEVTEVARFIAGAPF